LAVITSVDWGWWDWAWLVAASSDLQVVDVEVLAVARGGLALVAPEPVVHGLPRAEGESHSVLQVLGHKLVGLWAVTSHLDLMAILADGSLKLAKLITILVEVNFTWNSNKVLIW